jgi:hypothetical protein
VVIAARGIEGLQAAAAGLLAERSAVRHPGAERGV